MATANPFALLGDDDSDDVALLVALQQKKVATKPAAPVAAKLPTKPAPPALAVKDARGGDPPARGGFSGRGGVGRGRGGRGGRRPYENGNPNEGYGGSGGRADEGEKGRSVDRERGYYGGPRPYRGGGRRGGYENEEGGNAETDQPPRRVYERHSGTGRGYENKREGFGRGNWGKPTEEVIIQDADEGVVGEDKTLPVEKQQEETTVTEEKEAKGVANENEEKEAEDKEMTLEEYQKILEEKRKALLALKGEERKVTVDKELASLQQLSVKKSTEEVFAKLSPDKDAKKKETVERDERAKKSVSINEFLKPAEGETYYNPGGRGRGRGRGRCRGGDYHGGFGGGGYSSGPAFSAPAIDDPGHFPTLGGK